MKIFLTTMVFSTLGFAADLTGSWACEVKTEAGNRTPSFEFKQNGDALKGKYSGQLGEADVSGKVTGDKASWSFKSELGTIAYEGAVTGGEIKGNLSLDGQTVGTFSCKKK